MVIGKILIFPLLTVIFLSVSYQEAYGAISSQLTIGDSGVPGSDQSHFNFPAGVAVDSSGNIYVADADNHRVQIFDSFGNWKKTIGVSSIPTSEYSGVAVDSLLGDIYVADSF